MTKAPADSDPDAAEAAAAGSDPADTAAPPARRGGLFRWMKIGFGVLVVAFGTLFVLRNWTSISRALGVLGWWPVLAAFPLALGGVVASMFGWRAILADLGSPLRVSDAGRVFFPSQTGKYVPGSLWPVLAQMELGRQLRVPRKSSLAANALTLLLSVTIGLLLSAVLLPLGDTHTLRYWWVLLAVPVLAAFVHPRVSSGTLDRLLRLAHRQPLDAHTSLRGTARAAVPQVLSWLLLGLHAYVLVLGMHVPAGRALPLAVGGYILANCLGVLFVVAPAGAGVREAALAFALASLMDRPQALVVVLVSRVLMVAVDFLLAACWLLAVRRPSVAGEPRPQTG